MAAMLGGTFFIASLLKVQPPPESPPEPEPIIPVEVEVDDLIIDWVDFIQKESEFVDVVVSITNLNENWGAESIFYTFSFLDSSASEISSFEGVSFILPNTQKFIAIPNVKNTPDVSEVVFSIERVDWQELEDFIALKLDIRALGHQSLSGEFGFFEKVSGVVKNNSLFGLTNIDVNAVLLDGNGNIVGISRSDMQTMQPGEERLFEMFWPYDIIPSPKLEVIVDSNVFSNANFIQRFGTQEKFQEYPSATRRSRYR